MRESLSHRDVVRHGRQRWKGVARARISARYAHAPLNEINALPGKTEPKERVDAMHKRPFDFLESAGAVDLKFRRSVPGQQDERKIHADH